MAPPPPSLSGPRTTTRRKRPTTTRVSEHVDRISYQACRGGSEVALFRVRGDGHTWPGTDVDFGALGPVTHEINATELAWQFFLNHRSNRADLPAAQGRLTS